MVNKYVHLFDFPCLFLFFAQFLHESVHDEVVNRLKKAYAQIRVGNPWDCEYLVDFKGVPF